MISYHVTAELAGLTGRRRLLRGLLSGGLFAAVSLLFDLLWPSWSSAHSMRGEMVQSLIDGAIFGVLSAALIKLCADYDVLVSDDYITAVRAGYKRSVRKGQVKTVAESNGNILIAPSLCISKYGRFGTWFRGGIRIPKALPECTAIRDLALSWKDSTKV